MMRFVKLVFLMPLLVMLTLAATGESILDALRKRFPDRGSDVLQVAAKWLEDEYGATAAEDLTGVANWAVEANSVAAADEGLSPDAKRILRCILLNEPDKQPQEQVDQKVAAPRALTASNVAEQTPLAELQKRFPQTRLDVLQRAAKWLEGNFGATTAEDLDGVSEFAVNGMSLAANDRNLSADAKRILQSFFQGARADKKRRLASSSSSTSTSSSSMPASTTTTTTTTGLATTTVTATTTTTTTAEPATTTTVVSTTTTTSGPTTTTTTGPTTTTTTGPTTTTTTTTSRVSTTATTITTSTTSASSGRTYNTKVVLTVQDTAWVKSPDAKDIMTAAIVASNADITSKDQVNIISLTAARRLRELGRRLVAGSVECVFDVTFPASYTGPGLTPATLDKAALKDKLQNNAQGVSIAVTSVDVQVCICTLGCPGTTTVKATTTEGSEVTGATVSAQQLAASIAGIVLVKLLSGL